MKRAAFSFFLSLLFGASLFAACAAQDDAPYECTCNNFELWCPEMISLKRELDSTEYDAASERQDYKACWTILTKTFTDLPRKYGMDELQRRGVSWAICLLDADKEQRQYLYDMFFTQQKHLLKDLSLRIPGVIRALEFEGALTDGQLAWMFEGLRLPDIACVALNLNITCAANMKKVSEALPNLKRLSMSAEDAWDCKLSDVLQAMAPCPLTHLNCGRIVFKLERTTSIFSALAPFAQTIENVCLSCCDLMRIGFSLDLDPDVCFPNLRSLCFGGGNGWKEVELKKLDMKAFPTLTRFFLVGCDDFFPLTQENLEEVTSEVIQSLLAQVKESLVVNPREFHMFVPDSYTAEAERGPLVSHAKSLGIKLAFRQVEEE